MRRRAVAKDPFDLAVIQNHRQIVRHHVLDRAVGGAGDRTGVDGVPHRDMTAER